MTTQIRKSITHCEGMWEFDELVGFKKRKTQGAGYENWITHVGACDSQVDWFTILQFASLFQ